MAIWLGNKKIVLDSDLNIGNVTPRGVYVGDYFTWPENTTYTFANLALHYTDSLSYIKANGSNYAYYTATVYTWRGGVKIRTEDNVRLNVAKKSGDGFYVDSNFIYANNRTTITGNSRTATFEASYNSTTAGTFTVTQQENKVTGYTWNDLTDITCEYMSSIPAGGQYTVSPTLYAVQTGKMHYTSTSTADTYNTTFTWSFNYAAYDDFYLVNSSTGEMSASTRGTVTGSVRTSSTITANVEGKGGKTGSTSATVEQDANAYIDTVWYIPMVSKFEYDNNNTIPAGGGTIYPYIEASQSGNTRYTSGAKGVVWNYSFEETYTHTEGDGFFVDSDGEASASTRGTVTGATLTSSTIYVSVKANGKSTTSNTKIYQQENKYVSTTWNNPVVSLAYATPIGAGGGYTIPSTKYATQSGTMYYTSNATAATSNTAFTWSFSHTSVGRFTLVDSSTGKMSATTKGTSIEAITYSNDVTATATGAGSKTGSNKAKASQEANAITATTWNNPMVTSYYYTVYTIGASGGSSYPVVVASQTGTNTYTSQATSSTSCTPTLSYARTSGDSNLSINTTSGVVSVGTRGTTEGSTRTTTFTATATGQGKTGSKTATVTQQANTKTYHDWTTGIDIDEATMPSGPYNKVSCDGISDVYLECNRYFTYYYSYTSNASSSTVDSETTITGMTLSTDCPSWVSFNNNLVTVAENTTTVSDRTATITASYDGYISSKSFTQWKKKVTTYQYSIQGFGVIPSSISWNQSGTSYAATISGETVYQQITTKDGTTTTGSTTPYNDTSEYVVIEGEYSSDFYLRDYNTGTVGTELKWYYPTSNGKGYMYVYARYTNPYEDDKELEISYRDKTIIFTQKGVVPSISVSPTSYTNISYAGSSLTLTVTSNVSGWYASTSESWITTTTSGNIVTCTIAANSLDLAREGIVGIYYNGTEYASCSFIQKGKPSGEYTFSATSKVVLLAEVTAFTVDVISLYGTDPVPMSEFDCSIVQPPRFLISVESVVYNGGGSYTYNFSCTENIGSSARTATITFTQPEGSTKTATTTVTQFAGGGPVPIDP